MIPGKPYKPVFVSVCAGGGGGGGRDGGKKSGKALAYHSGGGKALAYHSGGGGGGERGSG